MNIEEIQELWSSDSKIDRMDISRESSIIPSLHSKYFKIYSDVRQEYRGIERKYKKLLRLKHEWYTGTISKEDLEKYKWDPNPLKILRQDIPMYIESDQQLTLLKEELDKSKDKLDFLDAIIKSFANRGYLLKTIVDWERFKVGG